MSALFIMTLTCSQTMEVTSENKTAENIKLESRASFEARRKEAQVNRRRKKKKTDRTLVASSFTDLYTLTGEVLGEGSYGKVCTCVNIYTRLEYAVKIIEKSPGLYSRGKVLKEIEIYHLCRGQANIIQLIEYFEEDDRFCLVFEKVSGGPLLDHIQARIHFTEAEASKVVADLASAIKFLHSRGIAHRDIKPDNILCVNTDSPVPVKLCDFDLCSDPSNIDISTPDLLTPVGSLEYMAPEVVNTFLMCDDEYDSDEDEDTIIYNKKCDMWSLGIIMYILLCGYAPFSGHCGYECGWDEGENCSECQESLFQNICEGHVTFPEAHWSEISLMAKSLILQLLTKDSARRLTAEELLSHPWVTADISTPLTTPSNLRRQTSIKQLEDFASRAMAVNRAVQRSETWDHAPSSGPLGVTTVTGSLSAYTNRNTRNHLWDTKKTSKCFSINELHSLELDPREIKAIV